jgi:hypothetical protein
MEQSGIPIERPFATDKDRWDAVTVADLIKALKRLPQGYTITYDTFCASIMKQGIKVDHNDETVSLS